MSDKDITERNIMKEQFPQANLLICFFDTLRTFRRENTCEIDILYFSLCLTAKPFDFSSAHASKSVFLDKVYFKVAY